MREHVIRVCVVACGVASMGPLCVPAGGPPPTGAAATPGAPGGPAPGAPAVPPDPPPPVTWRPFTGDLGCRAAGRQPRWLNAGLPIPLSACNRNYQIAIPFGTWNSVAAVGRDAEGPFGAGWSLEFETTLDRDDEGVIVRSGDRSELHFSHDGEGWAPEPYLRAALEHDEASDTFLLIDFSSRQRQTFVRHPSVARRWLLDRTIDAHGVVVRMVRDAAGRLVRVTDSIVERAASAPYWYEIDWTGDRVSAVRDASGRIWRYGYDGAGNVVSVTLPGRTGAWTIGYAGALVRTLSLPRLSRSYAFSFDGEGRLIRAEGPDGSRWEVTSDATLDFSGEFELVDFTGHAFRARFEALPRGQYLSYQYTAGRVARFERNADGYATRELDGDGRALVFMPDDARRPGTTTVVEHPMSAAVDGAFVEEVTWGDYFNPVVQNRTPGRLTRIRYAGVDDCGYEPPAWAFLTACVVESADARLTVRATTERAGTPGERRIVSYEHEGGALHDRAVVRDAFGRTIEGRQANGSSFRRTYDARGFVIREDRFVRQGGGEPTTFGTTRETDRDAMGRPLGTRTGPYGDGPLAGREHWETREERDEDGFVDVRSQLHSGRIFEEVRFEDRHETGVARLERRVATVGATRATGVVERELDEFGRVVQQRALVPDVDDPPEEHTEAYGERGHLLIGGRITYRE